MRSLYSLAFTLLLWSLPADALTVTNLTCEHRIDPTGLETEQPRLSWQFETDARGKSQKAYQVLAASSAALLAKDEADLWDSGRRESGSTYLVFYQGAEPLKTGQKVFWKVRVWDEEGNATDWSEAATFTMGVLDPEDWKAEWISFKEETPLHRVAKKVHLPPARYYRKSFTSEKKLERAYAFATALGVYELHLNGTKVGDALLAPGWTDYRKQAYYNAFDVTEQIRGGANCVGAVVADGWYAGYIGPGKRLGYGPYKTGRNIYGKTPALLVQIHLEYEDGSSEMVITDPTWQVSTGPELEADLLFGETYDARKELAAWSTPDYDAEGWDPAIAASANKSVKAPFYDKSGVKSVELGFVAPQFLYGYPAPPVRRTQELPAKNVSEPEAGVFVFDFGQTFSGVARLKITGEEGQEISIRYGADLGPDGKLRISKSLLPEVGDTYICKGASDGEQWTPRFTVHGVRYAQVTGFKKKPALEALTGIVLHSDTKSTSSFECSDPVVNRIFQNCVWTLRSNWVEIPAGALREDERLGGTGEAQLFARAACFHADNAAFFRKWFQELGDARSRSGLYPTSAPLPFANERLPQASGWSDAGILCVFAVWWMYGDQELVKEQWVPMKKYLQARRDAYHQAPGRFGASFGDLLNLNDPTPPQFLDLCYLALDCRLMAEMSRVAGNPIEQLNYTTWFGEVVEDFRKRYVNEDGSLKVKSQTAHVLALRFGMLTDKAKQKTTEDLLAMIKAKAGPDSSGMTTGMLGTKPLLPVLTWTGNHDTAVKLLQSRKFPSWGYEVSQGATTIWGRWGPRGNDEVLGTYSHSAFGAVSEWMMSMLAGIDTVFPGFQRIRLEPWIPSPESAADGVEAITWVRAHYDSCRGRIKAHWERRDDGSLLYECSIPVQCTALVKLPGDENAEILVDGEPLKEGRTFDGGFLINKEDGRISLNVLKSGSYRFEVK